MANRYLWRGKLLDAPPPEWRYRSDGAPKMPRCRDFDEDCPEVENKTWCWLHDPARGFCPWLTQTDPAVP